MKIKLTWPPSVNAYYRTVNGRILIAKKGRQYRDRVQRSLWEQKTDWHPMGDSRLRVIIEAHPPDYRKRDLDNLLKPVLDALETQGVFDNDSQIDDLRIVRKHKVIRGQLSVTLEKLDAKV